MDNRFIGLVIKNAESNDDSITLDFGKEGSLIIADDNQQCCENRYLTTDDNITSLIGQVFLAIEVNKIEIPVIYNDYGVHEQAFINIKTLSQTVTYITHNEHNGYYGGFSVEIKERARMY